MKSVDDLLNELTLEEKAAQLSGPSASELGPRLDAASQKGQDLRTALAGCLIDLAPDGMGHLGLGWTLCPDLDAMADFISTLQKALAETSRIPIPALVHLEALNGAVIPGAPAYPTAVAQAATWNPALIRKMAELTREHLLSAGVRHALSPVLDLARDPRWGRVHETFGEDPDLSAAMGVAFVRGLQGEDLRGGVAACAKHFLGYSVSQAGMNLAAVHLGRRTLREEYSRPFEAVIREAGIATVMNSYSEIDGVPVVADPDILTALLRDELGFDGAVVSDYGSIDHLLSRTRLVDGFPEGARLAIEAGLDIEFPDARGYAHLPELVRGGELDVALLDRATRRCLELKERLGLLDDLLGVTVHPGWSAPVPDRDADRATSRAMAGQAAVLLTNDGALPLAPTTRRIAVIGGPATEVRIHYGGYSGVAAAELNTSVAELQTLIADLTAAGDIAADAPTAVGGEGDDPASAGLDDAMGMRLIPTPGFPTRFEEMAREAEPESRSVAQALQEALPDADVVVTAAGGPEGTSTEDADRAAEAAVQADVAVVVVGERTGWVGGITAGEGYDRQELCLPGDQERLIEAAAATGTPVVAVVVSGRPLLLGRIAERSAAVLWAPLLGPAAGEAIADIITGRTSPSGRLPVSFPASMGQIPVFHGARAGSGYDRLGGADAAGYIDGSARPLFCFGHGLTYTDFEYGDIELATAELRAGDAVELTVTITNTGDRDGEEVVQLYARDVLASTTRPARQLLAFTRVAVAAGASRRVRMTAPVNALALVDRTGRLVLEPGEVQLMIGASSSDIRCRTSARIVGALTEVPPHERFLVP
ncbi:glycoside hydrolase family 3 N-terminal domain-containing protein [Actinomadura kijaniata]|uniref:glycoside hydrolase family 3 N-terminal domain-containing protein n=1 Tax=Actinomadura kijaniata TaxID=46161 RepID=UPI0008318E5D|nr:glycoside hydrolase family 3 N-terminal domain-containing protein [Actinomadura kijaniata]